MDTFERDKYLFSGKFKLRQVSNNISYDKEISFLLKEMRLYDVDFSNLLAEKPDINIKNLCLNLAVFILSNDEYIDDFNLKREIPVKKLLRATDITKAFLDNWRDYIVIYTLIMSNEIYVNIQKYLNVIEKSTETKNLILLDKNDQDNRQYTGIVMKSSRKSSVILTCEGDFVKVKNTGAYTGNGGIITATEVKGIRHYRKYILSAIFVAAMFLSIYYYINNKALLTVVIKATSPITVEVNYLNKITEMNSPTAKGLKLVDSVKVKNHNVDDGLYDILKYIKENDMIPKNGVILIVVTGNNLGEGKLEKSEQFLKENSIKVIINNGGEEKRIN